MAFIDQLFEEIRLFFFQFSAQLLNLFKADQIILIIVAHAFGIIPDDFLQFGAFIEDGNGFIDFLLTFTK